MSEIFDHDRDFDPAQLAEDAVQANLDPGIFEQIKDQEIARPKNIVEWIRDRRFLNVTPFPKQIEICANFYGHFCPRCTDPGLLDTERWGNKLLRIEVDYPLAEAYDRITLLNEGVCPKCNVNRLELLKSGELNHYLNLNGCAGMRCVSGDTVLFTTAGIKTIKDLDPGHVETGFVELGLEVASKGGLRLASDHYYAGQAEALEIELQYGIRLTGSLIHPVEVLGSDGVIKWKKLGELSSEDRVHVMPGSDVWGDQEIIGYEAQTPHPNALSVRIPSKWSTDLARFLGYIVSDGTYNSDYIVAFSVSDPVIREDYLGLCKRLFDLVPQPRRSGETLSAGSSCESLAFCSVEVRKFLRFLGIGDVTGRSKTIPQKLLETPREIVLAFLGGLFLGDGGFYENVGGKKVTITYTTVSEDLAVMLQQILLNLGVVFTLGRCESRAFNSNDLLGHDAFFMSTKTIEDGACLGSLMYPYLVGEKKDTAAQIAQARKDGHTILPGSGPAVRALINLIKGDKPNFRFKEARDILASCGGATRLKYVKGDADASLQLVKDLLEATERSFKSTDEFQQLRRIANVSGRFFAIRQISRLDEPIDLYDLNVPDGHEFLANCIVSHNSSKTVIVGGLISTYQVARFLLLRSPSKFFGLMENQTLHSTFVAITAGQAKETLWQAFKDRIEAAPWFKDYHAFLTEESKRLSKEKFYDIKETFVSYDHRQIICSYSGPDIRTLRGRTRFNCVTGDTLVNTSRGWLRMDELAVGKPDGPSPIEIEVMTDDGVATTSHFHSSGVSPTIRVVTEGGYEITGTPDHPLYVLDARGNSIETKLKDIKEGDHVTLRKGALFTKDLVKIDTSPYECVGPHSKYEFPDLLTPELAWLAGLILAEGNVSYKSAQVGGVKWVTGDREVLDRSVSAFKALFCVAPPVYEEKTMWRVSCQIPRVSRFFLDLGLGGDSYTKTIPALIRRSPKAVVAAFVRGFFDGDAHSEVSHIAIHSASESILKEIQIILLGFGVASKRKKYERDFNDGRGDCTYHLLKIYGHNVDKFHEEIGFSLTRKQIEKQKRYVLDRVPVSDKTGLEKVRVEGTKQKYVCRDSEVRRLRLTDYYYFVDMPTRDRLGKLDLSNLHLVDPELANNLSELHDRNDFVFEKVKSTTPFKKQSVFDLTVPGPHCFVAAGILNRNTGIDEKGWFDVQADSATSGSTKVRMNAHETNTALVKSLRTIRSASMALRESGIYDPPEAFNCDVSSPSSLNDAIMVGLREANEDSTVYPFHYSTWEMNPFIPMNSLRSEMRKRREFERDYAAVPPLGANQFIDNQHAVEKCQTEHSQNVKVTWTKKHFTDDYGEKTVYIDATPMRKDKTKPMILTVDTGLSNNSFAVMLWSFDRESRKPVCEVALECMPEETDTERILVNFPLMFEKCLVPLVSSYRVIMAAFDRWNSIDQVQRLRKDYKVEAIQYVLKWSDFTAIRARIGDSGIILPKMEIPLEDVRKSDRRFEDLVRSVPITHLALQILTVREGGRKVMKPINGTDDLFRALCLAVRFIMDPEYTKKFEQYGSALGTGRPTVGVVRTNYGEQATANVRSREGVMSANIGIRKGFIGSLK